MLGCADPVNAPPLAQVLARLGQLRCCPWRAGQLATAIDVLQARQMQR